MSLVFEIRLNSNTPIQCFLRFAEAPEECFEIARGQSVVDAIFPSTSSSQIFSVLFTFLLVGFILLGIFWLYKRHLDRVANSALCEEVKLEVMSQRGQRYNQLNDESE